MDSTLHWIIGVGVGLLLIIQILVFIGIFFLAKRFVVVMEKVGQLQTKADYLLENTEPVLKMTHGLMSELKEASVYFTQGVQHISAIAEMAKDEAADVKSLLGDSTALARREMERTKANIEKVQRTLTDVTDQFEKTTAVVQDSVLGPAREFSYLMFGLRRAIEALAAGNRLPVDRAYQDEEMFI